MAKYAVIDSGIKRKKKRKALRVITLVLTSIIVIALLLGGWFYWKSMTPTILDIAKTRLKSETTRAVNEAVSLSLDGINYADIITVEKNSDNEKQRYNKRIGARNGIAFSKQNKYSCIARRANSVRHVIGYTAFVRQGTVGQRRYKSDRNGYLHVYV